MNGPDGKIQILAPFNVALEWTKQVLFRPFDLEKWLVIGFAAFLSHFAGGGTGFNFNPASLRNRGNWNWDFRTTSHQFYSTTDHVSLWLVLFITATAFIFIMALVLVLLWIGCRGRFMFVDCVARNRGAIREPWHEFRSVGNSLFWFTLAVALLFLLIAVVAGSPVLLWLVMHRGDVHFGPIAVLCVGFWIAVVFVCALAWGLISQFMIVAMYRRRCRAIEAFRSSVSLIMTDPVPFILYLLFLIVLGIFVAIISCVATCLTCCIAALPYIGTVILLPLYVFLAAYPLFFARQFGPDWDAWANLTAPAVTASPGAGGVPPVQSPPTIIPESQTPPGPVPPARSPYEPPDTPPAPPPPV